jgi:hypothetical protein
MVVHVVKMLDHVIDAPISVPSHRRFCHKESGWGIPHKLSNRNKIMTILVVDQFFIDTLEIPLFVCVRGVRSDAENRTWSSRETES